MPSRNVIEGKEASARRKKWAEQTTHLGYRAGAFSACGVLAGGLKIRDRPDRTTCERCKVTDAWSAAEALASAMRHRRARISKLHKSKK